jgi:NAD(P)-dependent dehydrogenase (short-subunit alcohol dehydrogenase family)
MDLSFFSDIVELNLVATFNLNRLQAWQMSKNDPNPDGERGVIINTASIAAFEGQIGQVAYSAAKGGLAQWPRVCSATPHFPIVRGDPRSTPSWRWP